MTIALPLCASLSLILGLWKPWAVWMPLAVLTYEAVTNLVRRRKCRFWYDNHTLQVESGVWGRQQSLLNFERVQHVAVKTSPYLRSKGLATLVLHTAGKAVTIPYIPEGQARYLADLSLVRVEFARDADRAGVSCP